MRTAIVLIVLVMLVASCGGGGGRTQPFPPGGSGEDPNYASLSPDIVSVLVRESSTPDGYDLRLTIRIWEGSGRVNLQLNLVTNHPKGAWAWADYRVDDVAMNSLGTGRINAQLDREFTDKLETYTVEELPAGAYAFALLDWRMEAYE